MYEVFQNDDDSVRSKAFKKLFKMQMRMMVWRKLCTGDTTNYNPRVFRFGQLLEEAVYDWYNQQQSSNVLIGSANLKLLAKR